MHEADESRLSTNGGSQTAKGMRVIVLETDATVRAKLQGYVREVPPLNIVACADNWFHCLQLLDRYVPELLIARPAFLPSPYLERVSESGFPILMIMDETTTAASETLSLRVPLDARAASNALAAARDEIYVRKANELSELVACYLQGSSRSYSYLSHLKVEEQGCWISIPMEDIVSLEADGNYVQVHTAYTTYEVRETLSRLGERLDPAVFARVHRSFIVNLRYVQNVTNREGAALLVQLSTGTEIPIGPNYRQDFGSAVQMRSRLSA